MSLWILAILLLVMFGAIGFAKGAIRMSISLVGVILGIMLAVPLGGVLKPMMGTIGIKNPVWAALIPPVIVFFIIYLAFVGISFAIHHKINLFYKYKRDDADRIRWERVNKNTGVAVGLLTGTIYFFAIGSLIYAAGYLTVQLSAEENNPGTIKFINNARMGMSKGLDRAMAVFDPASKMYYEAADVLGLLYHNPLLQSRLSTYPYFISLSHRAEFKELATDKEYNDLIFGKAPVNQIIAHPRTQGLLSNSEIMEYLKGTDFKDLKEYLRTGKSAKYDEEEILGVWNLDKDAVLTNIRKVKPDLKSRELMVVKKVLEALPPITLSAMPDNKIIITSEEPAADPSAAGGEQAAPAEGGPVEPPIDPYRSRYGIPNPATQPAQAPQPKAEPPAPKVIPKFNQDATWKKDAGQYSIVATDESGKEVTGTVSIKADEMTVQMPGITLVFFKQ